MEEMEEEEAPPRVDPPPASFALANAQATFASCGAVSASNVPPGSASSASDIAANDARSPSSPTPRPVFANAHATFTKSCVLNPAVDVRTRAATASNNASSAWHALANAHAMFATSCGTQRAAAGLSSSGRLLRVSRARRASVSNNAASDTAPALANAHAVVATPRALNASDSFPFSDKITASDSARHSSSPPPPPGLAANAHATFARSSALNRRRLAVDDARLGERVRRVRNPARGEQVQRSLGRARERGERRRVGRPSARIAVAAARRERPRRVGELLRVERKLFRLAPQPRRQRVEERRASRRARRPLDFRERPRRVRELLRV
eukprot:11278-Pelagococcus_subviridis.AAC.4